MSQARRKRPALPAKKTQSGGERDGKDRGRAGVRISNVWFNLSGLHRGAAGGGRGRSQRPSQQGVSRAIGALRLDREAAWESGSVTQSARRLGEEKVSGTFKRGFGI